MILATRSGPHALPPFLTIFLAAMSILAAGTCYGRDVPYVPTPPETVEAMLEMAGVGPNDVVYDLGSGDGRIVIAAVDDFNASRAVGVDIDPVRVRESIENAEAAGVGDRTEFHRGDIFTFDFDDASVVTMYLLPDVNTRLRPRILNELRPGTRIVSHQFDMGDWEPDGTSREGGSAIYYWVVPAQVDGEWSLQAGGQTYSMELDQKYQEVSGTVQEQGDGGQSLTISQAELNGGNLEFTASGGGQPVQFKGQVAGADRIEGVMTIGGERHSVVARRIN